MASNLENLGPPKSEGLGNLEFTPISDFKTEP
jgi:hypothetical protein